MSHKLTIKLDLNEKEILVSRIQVAMARKGMTIAHLHDRVRQIAGPNTRGTSYGGVWNYAHNPPRSPRLEILKAIAKALDEPIGWLLYGEADPDKEEELERVFDQMLSEEAPDTWDDQLREGIKRRASILGSLGTPLVRAMFLSTLRRLIDHRFPDGCSREDTVRLSGELSMEILFGVETRLRIGGPGPVKLMWQGPDWESRCVARMHAINLSIPPPHATRRQRRGLLEKRQED